MSVSRSSFSYQPNQNYLSHVNEQKICENNCNLTYIDCLDRCGENECYSTCAANWEACYKACPCSDDCPDGCEFCDNQACACSVSQTSPIKC